MSSKRFENKVVIVTGTSRGIGQSIVLAFASEGAHVVGIGVGDQTETSGKVQALGAKFSGYQADFAKLNQKAAQELVARIIAETGKVDALVNNAGIIRRAPIVDHSEEDWNTVLQINLSAPFFLSQAVAKWWLTTGKAQAPADARLKVVNVASMLSFQGGILVPGYAAAKSGIAGITKAFANELAKERCNFNAIAPGYIATENTRPIREDAKRNESILARIPEARWGAPEDIAAPILFLASKDADYMNGTIMNVDGGWLSR
jgi:2-dehydro-3-deoxy-D-gluconate 5-dehydrogenase